MVYCFWNATAKPATSQRFRNGDLQMMLRLQVSILRAAFPPTNVILPAYSPLLSQGGTCCPYFYNNPPIFQGAGIHPSPAAVPRAIILYPLLSYPSHPIPFTYLCSSASSPGLVPPPVASLLQLATPIFSFASPFHHLCISWPLHGTELRHQMMT